MRNTHILIRFLSIPAAAITLAFGGPVRGDNVDWFKFTEGNDHVRALGFTLNGHPGHIDAGRYSGQFQDNGDPSHAPTNWTSVPFVNVFCSDLRHLNVINPYVTIVHLGAVTDPAGSLVQETTSPNRYFYETSPVAGSPGAGMASALTPNDYNPGPYGTLTTAQAMEAIAYLDHKYLNMAVTATFTKFDLAAIQMAMWDLSLDGNSTAGGTNFANGGIFTYTDKIGTGSSARFVSTYENEALGALNGSKYSNVIWVQAPRNHDATHYQSNSHGSQDFIYLGVPEPIFYQLGVLLGLGGLGLVRARTSRRSGLIS